MSNIDAEHETKTMTHEAETPTVTGETITDEQVSALLDAVLSSSPRLVDDDRIIRAACHALGRSQWCGGVDCRFPHGHEAKCRTEGRETCAAAYNARFGGRQ